MPGSTTKIIVKTFLRQKEICPNMLGRSSSVTEVGKRAYFLSLATSLSRMSACADLKTDEPLLAGGERRISRR